MIGAQWTGWDGSEWDLRNGPHLFLTDAGVTGLLHLESDVFTRTSSVIDGQVVTGWTAKAREVVLPIDISSDVSAEDWFSRQMAFNRTIRPDRYGTLTVTDPIGNQRRIKLRADGSAGGALGIDPTIDMGLTTVYNMVADDPWYHGPTVIQPFLDASDVARSFYDGPGPDHAGPPFYLGTGQATGATTITNVGDYDQWPIWRFRGPINSILINVLGQRIVSSTPIPDGVRFEIDTRQGEKVAWLYDQDDDNAARTNVTDYLTTADFARIPDGANVPATVLINGTGTAEVEFEPRYFRALG